MFDYPRRIPHDCTVVRYIVYHDAPGTNYHIIAYHHVTQYGSSATYRYVVTNSRKFTTFLSDSYIVEAAKVIPDRYCIEKSIISVFHLEVLPHRHAIPQMSIRASWK